MQAIKPDTEGLTESFPKLTTSFSVLNEFFNELAYNPGKAKGGYLFFLDWASHNLNSVVSSSDVHGPLGRSLLYLNCEVLKVLQSVASINDTVEIIVGLINPPSKAECEAAGILPKSASASAAAASAHGSAAAAAVVEHTAGSHRAAPSQGLLSGLIAEVFGHGSATSSQAGSHPASHASASSAVRSPVADASGALPSSASSGAGG